MRGKHVLVTGAAGFVGSQLVARLRAEGHRVVGVDAYRGTTSAAVAAQRLGGLAADSGFDLMELDLVVDDLSGVLAGAGTVFHLAARAGARDPDHGLLTRDNATATARLLEHAAVAGATKVVFASSSSVYGDAGVRGPSAEGDALQPLSHYGVTKQAAEALVRAAPLHSTIVRLFTVYGPGQRTDMAFARFISACLNGHGAPQYQPAAMARDYTYVSDAVEGLMLAWQRGTAPVYNVSGGALIDLATACRLIEELTGCALETQPTTAPPEPSVTRADLALAQAELGYQPRVGLREGLRHQIAATFAAAMVNAT